MSKPRMYLLIVAALTLGTLVLGSNRLRLCVVESVHTGQYISSNCKKIENDGFECVVASDRIECLRALTHGNADFAVFEPEDLFASQNHGIAHVLITHELRLFQNDTSNYEMVVLVSKNVQSIADLKGKQLCHPGFDTADNDWTPVFSNYFQNQIIPKRCNPSETLLENKIAALSENFQHACIPGAWSSAYDTAIDDRLKTQYSNLCALCDNPACYTDDKYHGREGVLLCLTESDGDIAWARLEDAKEYFKHREDTAEYRFLCPDGMTRPLNWWSPCSWITRPWPVLGARSEIAERVAKVIDTLNEPKAQWQSLLLQLLEAYRATTIRTDTIKTPEDYLHQFVGLSSAYARASCYPSRQIKWCVSSNIEERKCQWLREAGNSYNLEPSISCIQLVDRKASIQALTKGFCDFFVANPEELMDAKEQNLTVATELVAPYLKNFNNIAIYVKAASSYARINDLKGARACFPKFKSIGWNAFVAVMRNQTNDPIWWCSDEKAMSTFFGSMVYPTDDTLESKWINSTYDCLLSGKGDVAIVSVISADFENNTKLRRICVDDKSMPDCILTWTTLGSVLVQQNQPIVRRREITSLLEEMDVWFGIGYPAPTPAITLYAPFDGEKNVIFSGMTVSLIQDIGYVTLPRPYPEILNQLQSNKSQPITCGAASSNFYNGLIISSIVALLLKSQM